MNSRILIAGVFLIFVVISPLLSQEFDNDEIDDFLYLISIIDNNDLESIENYLNSNRNNIVITEAGYRSILNIAIRGNNYDALELILKHGVGFDLGRAMNIDYDWFALFETDNVKMIQLVLDYGYDPNLVMKIRDNAASVSILTPLSLAARYNKKEILILLLEAGANPNSVMFSTYSYPYSFRYCTPFDILANNSDLQEIITRNGGISISKVLDAGGKAVVNESGLRLRSTPGLNGQILFTLNAGLILRVIKTGDSDTIDGSTNHWVFVITPDGNEGWVFDKFLTYESIPNLYRN